MVFARAGVGVAFAGMLLVAATYGMARFGVGLFAPGLAADRPALRPVVGWASAAQFVSYSLAALVAMRLSDRRPRIGLLLAGSTAVVGCIGIAVATSPGWFVLSVFVGGMGAGLASPAMVRVIESAVAEPGRPTAQSLVNAGTAVGLVATGVLALVVASLAPAWLAMAATTAVATVLVLALARSVGAPPGGEAEPGDVRVRALASPAASAVVVGAGSALIWTHGPLLATELGAVGRDDVGLMWIVLGVGGLVGPLTGVAVLRWGLPGAWRVFAGLLVVANLALASGLAATDAWSTYAAMGLFGAGYMCLSGVLILWAREVQPEAAGAGTSVLFIALAIGQAVGAAVAGPVEDLLGAVPATLAAAALCLVGGATARLHRHVTAPDEVPLSTPRR